MVLTIYRVCRCVAFQLLHRQIFFLVQSSSLSAILNAAVAIWRFYICATRTTGSPNCGQDPTETLDSQRLLSSNIELLPPKIQRNLKHFSREFENNP